MRRRASHRLTVLNIEVNQPVGGIYKVFLHFMGPSYINGDHVPLDGRFPTPYWVPGYYITDEHVVTPKTGDQLSAPSGVYQIYMGFFAGDRRMKVVSGPQDGDNRVKLGLLRLK